LLENTTTTSSKPLLIRIVGLPNNSYKPITNTAWVRARLCILQNGCTRLAVTSDKVYQLLAHDRWFFPGTPASSTTKTGRHDIAKLLLKVALSTKNQSNQNLISSCCKLSLSYIKCGVLLSSVTRLHFILMASWIIDPCCISQFRGGCRSYVCTPGSYGISVSPLTEMLLM
jgi:hypothetical protein